MNRRDGEQVIVAIDGPSASGKSTVARGVAKRLGFVYVDSGSVYRGVTWLCLWAGVDPRDAHGVVALMDEHRICLAQGPDAPEVEIDGKRPGVALRTESVDANVSLVAAIPGVRSRVVALLREARTLGSLVMEGRDIGSFVFPDTPFKFYLDASAEERARRRHRDKAGEGREASLDVVGQALLERDRIDTSRQDAPLRIVDGARVIDSTHLDIDEVVDRVVDVVRSGTKRGARRPRPDER